MPGLPLVLHPDAVEEAQAAWQWYLERSQSAADSWLIGAQSPNHTCIYQDYECDEKTIASDVWLLHDGLLSPIK